MSDDLLERLRACHDHNVNITFYNTDEINPDGPEAAEEIVRLRKALEAVKAEGLTNHNTRCRAWWPEVLAALEEVV